MVGLILLNLIEDKSIIVKPFKNFENIKKIENSLLLVYTGIKRKAETIEKDKMKNFSINQ